MGLTLQRGVLVAWAFSLPVILLWWNVTLVLTLLGQDLDIVALTSHYLRMLSPTILSVSVVANLQRCAGVPGAVVPWGRG